MTDGRASVSSPTLVAVTARAGVARHGECGAFWGRTTNPAGSVGEGTRWRFVLAAAVADLEFVQFHRRRRGLVAAPVERCARRQRCSSTTGRSLREELAPRDVVRVQSGLSERLLICGR